MHLTALSPTFFECNFYIPAFFSLNEYLFIVGQILCPTFWVHFTAPPVFLKIPRSQRVTQI